jgi:hypothetical protein
MARGANAAWFLNRNGRHDETDFTATDWFQYADWPLDEVRAHFGIPAKSAKSIGAGSVTPWEHGGISPFQFAHGGEVAEQQGYVYDSFGAVPPS